MERAVSNNKLVRKSGKDKRCSNRSQRQTATFACFNDRNDFLNHQFLPLVADGNLIAVWKMKQTSFFASLENLAALYHFEPLAAEVSVYPSNILLAFQDAKSVVEEANKEVELYILEKRENEFLLATGKTYSTKHQLYFFPLEPVYKFLQQKDCRTSSKLLLSVLAYCFQVLQLPSFTEGDYLDGCYEYFKEWLESENEEEFDGESIAEINYAVRAGKKLAGQCKKPHHLRAWKKRMKDFVPSNKKDESILKIAKEAYSLYDQFPTLTFHHNISPSFNDPSGEGSTRPDQYISFSWAAEGWLQEQEFDFVNNDLQENAAIDEPIVLQCFDVPQAAIKHDDTFETKLFAFLQNLSIFLYNDL
jgi:hypothetical protein